MLRARTAAFWTLAIVTLLTRVGASFDTTSTPLVTAPIASTAGAVVVSIPAVPAIPGDAPRAIVVNLTQRVPERARFTLAVGDQTVCTRTIDAVATARLDCRIDRWPAEVRDVRLFGPTAPWVLESLHVSAIHAAFAFGAMALAPAGGHPWSQPSWWVLALVLGAFVALQMIAPCQPRRPLAKIAMLSIAAIGVAAMVALIAAPFVTPYIVVISPGMFVRVMLVAAIARTWAITRALFQRTSRPVAAAMIVAIVVFAGYRALVDRRLVENYGGNYSGFLQIGERQFDRNPLLSERADVREAILLSPTGYDGQYMYVVAFDPFLRAFRDHVAAYRRVVDAPPYRFGRIGYPLLAKTLSGDRWRAYPVVMMGILLASVAICAFLVSLLARDAGLAPAWGLVIAALPGFWPSIDAGLPEPLAAACALLGFVCVRRGRWAVAALAFAVSLLVRETGVVFVAAILATEFLAGRKRAAIVCGVAALAPVAAWHLFVGHVLASDFGRQAYFFSPPDLTWPFAGFVDLWRQVRLGAYYPGDVSMTVAAIAYPSLLIAGALLAVWYFARTRSLVALAAIAYALVAISLNFDSIWTHVGNGQRGTFELFVVLAALAVTAAHDRWLGRARTAFWIAAGGYIVLGSFQALAIRHALAALIW